MADETLEVDVARNAFPITVPTGTLVTCNVGPRVKLVQILEMEDVGFHTNSAVMPPAQTKDKGSAEQEVQPGGLLVAQTVLRFAARFPDKKLLVAGHTDTTGSDAFNLELSRLRARNVRAFFAGDKATWVDVAAGRHKVEDWQGILTWLAATRAWDCDPGGVDGKVGPKTKKAIKGFRAAFNAEHGGSLPSSDAAPARADWEAFYDCYDHELATRLSVKVEDLPARREKVRWLEPAMIGCGEHWPRDKVGVDGYKSQENRRVEVLFFDEPEAPKLSCHTGDACDASKCDLYAKGRYKATYIPIDVDGFVPEDDNVVVLGWPDALGERLPGDVVLRLTAGERAPIERRWSEGAVKDGARELTFEGVPRRTTCTLVAASAEAATELVLFEEQVLDDPTTPAVWLRSLGEMPVVLTLDDAVAPAPVPTTDDVEPAPEVPA
ncbi:MAG: hypothetical protein M9894_24030 [Planctomycetes bacterium]|nr:hypothetical protein [Planctomycetota bacterium]